MPVVTESPPVVVNVPLRAPLVGEAVIGTAEAPPLLTFDSLQERYRNSGISVELTRAPKTVRTSPRPDPTSVVERVASVETTSPPTAPSEFWDGIQRQFTWDTLSFYTNPHLETLLY